MDNVSPFLLDLLPKLELQRLDSPNGRRYITPEGNSYTSVTTFLSNFGKEDLQGWRDFVGEDKANKIAKRAATRGTLIHETIEDFVFGRPVNIPTGNFVASSLWKAFKPALQASMNNIRAIEYPLYSDVLKMAGTMDCFADWEGIPSIIDFKTSRNKKNKADIENYFLQASIYSIMMKERYGINIPNLVILIGSDFSDKIQVFQENRNNWLTKLSTNIKEYRRGNHDRLSATAELSSVR